MGDRKLDTTLLINVGATALVVIALLIALDPFGSDQDATPAGEAAVAEAVQAATTPPPAASSAGQERAVSETVTTYVTRSEPADCKFTYTQRFVDRFFDGSGAEAIARCQDGQAEHDASDGDQAVIERTSINSGRATVVTGTNGGLFDGTVQTLRLVRDAGRWKVDSISAIEIDRNRWDRAQHDSWLKNGYTAEEADCVLRKQQTVETGELERTLLAASQGRKVDELDVKALDCVSPATLERKFNKQVWKETSGVAPSVVDCITSSMVKSMSDAELRRLIFFCEFPGPEVISRAFQGCLDARA